MVVLATALASFGAIHPGLARAADPHVEQDLQAAEQALVNLDYEAANKAADAIAQEPGLSHEELVRVFRVVALTDAVLDKETAAREAFQRLLTYDPTYTADPNLGPKVQAPFLEARGFLRAQIAQPGIDVSVSLRSTDGGAIRVTTRDPLHIAQRAAVGFRWSADAAFTTEPVAIGDGASAPIPPPPIGTTRLDYYVQVFDEHGNAIFESGNATNPKSATVELSPVTTPPPPPPPIAPHRSILASPIFWTIAGVVVAGATTGVYFAARGTSSAAAPTGILLTPSVQCGYPASSACR